MHTCRTTQKIHDARPLAAALASLLGAQAFAGLADNGHAPSIHSGFVRQIAIAPPAVRAANKTSPATPHNVLTVKNCQDDGADSLRALISAAGEGDTIQFDTAQMQCSVITLSSSEILVTRNNLTLQGPPTGGQEITISGDDLHRVFNHGGSGTLSIESLKIEHGYVQGRGGCILSAGSVSLNRTEVAGCAVINNSSPAQGGGVSAAHDITLRMSTISGNRAGNATTIGYGGGIVSSGHVTIKYSSITDNYASSRGGGVYCGLGTADIYVLASTIDHNSSVLAAALSLSSANSAEIINSTVSSNIAGEVAIHSRSGSLYIESSTIAFNHADSAQSTGGVFFQFATPTDRLTVQSSIIADNTSGPNNAAADVFSSAGAGVVFGSANLVGASNVWPPGVFTVTSDPRLGPLQFNGGFTRTHALLPDSPARGAGNDNAAQVADQRGPGYPRTTGTGPSATVDIGSVQFDSIFFGGFEFTN